MSQSFYKFYYHIIFGTKYRKPIIALEIEKLLKEYLPGKIKEKEGLAIELNMVDDHLHLLASIPPKISVSEFIHKIKGSSSHFVNVNFGKQFFYWQAGYGALTLSEKGVPFVRQYIANQKQRHARNDLLNILEYIPEESGK
ncbi:IS200/IS605 family transposase [Patescibacteria group bacterium]|nr:IS200/IS605 family transposase [Patescibacteria group bacterium]MBU2264217.1 IS200/IS605 family transposase [Patescibacteria group bacterium]